MKGFFNFLLLEIAVLLLLPLTIESGSSAIEKDQSSHIKPVVKRQTSTYCEQRYLDGYGTSHSACLKPSSNLEKSGVSCDDIKLIVDLHNADRRAVKPTATDMLQLSWDEGLAKIAQGWASSCPKFGHDESGARADYGRFNSVGQNAATGQVDWKAAVSAWMSEKEKWTYKKINIDTDMGVLHYTQAIWADTYKIGCGFALCNGLKSYYCNYAPPANYTGVYPYTSGESCATCNKTCNDKLCDCKGMVCVDDEKRTLDRSNCSCSCKHNLGGEKCEVDCAKVKQPEPYYCIPIFFWICDPNYQLRNDCPFYCGICKRT